MNHYVPLSRFHHLATEPKAPFRTRAPLLGAPMSSIGHPQSAQRQSGAELTKKGAAVFRPQKCELSMFEQRGISCFNGAAVFRPRRGWMHSSCAFKKSGFNGAAEFCAREGAVSNFEGFTGRNPYGFKIRTSSHLFNSLRAILVERIKNAQKSPCPSLKKLPASQQFARLVFFGGLNKRQEAWQSGLMQATPNRPISDAVRGFESLRLRLQSHTKGKIFLQ